MMEASGPCTMSEGAAGRTATALELIRSEPEGLAGELDGTVLKHDQRAWVAHLLWLAERADEVVALDVATSLGQFAGLLGPLQAGLTVMGQATDAATWLGTMVQLSQQTWVARAGHRGDAAHTRWDDAASMGLRRSPLTDRMAWKGRQTSGVWP